MYQAVESAMYSTTMGKVPELLGFVLEAGLVPNLIGPPGIGKSAVVHQVAKASGLEMIDYRASTGAPEDQNGLPFRDGDRARFLPFSEIFPLEGMELPPGKQGWLLFLDEMNSAPRNIMASLYKLILDRYVGQFKLHPKVHIVTAGNRDTDRAITTKLPTTMQSRLINIDVRVDTKEWLRDVATEHGYDPRVIAFLNQYPDRLMDFDPEHTNRSFCCPRTWNFMDKLVKLDPSKKGLTHVLLPVYAGTLTPGVATEFVQYTQVFGQIPSLADVLANPNMPIDRDLSIRWATVTSLTQSLTTTTDMSKIDAYISRFDLPFRIIFWRMAFKRFPALIRSAQCQQALMMIQKYLNGDSL